MNPFYMMQFVNQVRQIKQNPNQLATLLRQRGMITDDQFADVSKMGGNYEQIGRYLMQQGRMPSDVSQYQKDVSQVQNLMK